MLSDEGIIRCLADYHVRPSGAHCQQVRAYVATLLRWNRSISLTAITNEVEILRFHFGESLFALSAVGGINGRLADVGSGAGFPGLPLRIFDPTIDLTLIESNSKKCAFLSEVVRELGLARVRVLRARFEDVGSVDGPLNVVVSRALGGYEQLLMWSSSALAVDGKVVLWVGEADAHEISKQPSWRWDRPVAIPGSKRRFILSGSPIARQVK
jgi:16S rRNA (guanine527-N7)-methyltransferase